MTRITTATRRRRPWGRARGTAAVIVLLTSALDHLISAITGCRPIAATVRRFAAPIAAAWRSAAWRTSSSTAVRIWTAPADERTSDHATDA